MRGHVATLAAGALLALFGWMAASVSREHCVAADEILHVTAGYAYGKFGDFRLQPENGLLPQRLAALPLLVQDVRFPQLNQPAWLHADVAEISHQFFYETGNDPARMLTAARTMIALLGIACGVLVFAWARSLFGVRGALVSAALFAFCPNLLAHAGFATSDMAACLGFLAAVLAGWRLLHRVTPGRMVATGATAALLGLSKFSAPLLVPMLGLMAIARAWRGAALPVRLGKFSGRLRGARATAALAGAFAGAALLGWVLMWGAYDFRYVAVRGAGGLNHPWAEVMLDTPVTVAAKAIDQQPTAAVVLRPGAVQTVVRVLRAARALPEGWLYGLAHVDRYARWRPAFFLGEYRATGWVEFFPVAFGLKTPLPVFALLALAAAGLATHVRAEKKNRRRLYRLVPLAALGAVYGVFALTSHLNIGHRHILPLYPVLYLLAGAIAFGLRERWVAITTVGLLGWHAWASLAIRPHYLAYFNPLLGGPPRAYEKFVDSSLDWGQDLPGLKRWLDAHAKGEKIFLSYFGSGAPAHEGIRATRLADGNFDLRGRELAPPMTGGLYCISATMFQQVYTLVRHGWAETHERRYRELRAWTEAWRAGRDKTPREAAIPKFVEFEHLCFGRLCAGLQRRAPDAEIGYSILIFRLTDTDVRALLDGPPPFFP